MRRFDSRTAYHQVIIIGAGASGLFCAWQLARAGIPSLVLEAGAAAGRKLSISGGGHCNFSNRNMSLDKFLSPGQSDFCLSALTGFVPSQMLNLLDLWHIPWEERSQERLFLKVRAQNLTGALVREITRAGSQIAYGQSVQTIVRHGACFRIITAQANFTCQYLCLALGSPAHPGIAPASWNLPKMLRHTIRPPTPALTPLHFAKTDQSQDIFRRLSGIGIDCILTLVTDCEPRSWQGRLLFTHSGLSGPAILNASLYWQPHSTIHVNFLPSKNFETLLDAVENRASTPQACLRRYLPPRLVSALLPPELLTVKNSQLSRKNRKLLASCLHSHVWANLHPGNLKEAEVCSGGVKLEEVDANTMQSRICPNLYLTGEMLDVTGELGGYNLHWAWASANAAANALIKKCR